MLFTCSGVPGAYFLAVSRRKRRFSSPSRLRNDSKSYRNPALTRFSFMGSRESKSRQSVSQLRLAAATEPYRSRIAARNFASITGWISRTPSENDHSLTRSSAIRFGLLRTTGSRFFHIASIIVRVAVW